MPVYNGNSKAKDLYYGGTKIKEAYYGSTKVYSSIKPLYYCYINTFQGGSFFIYTSIEYEGYPPIGSTIKYITDPFFAQATTSSQLNGQATVTNDSPGYSRYPSGDLYT